MMDIAAFRALVETYGADARRWPADRRLEAEAFAARDPAAHALLVEAESLDAALDAWRPEPASEGLRQAILDAAPALRPALLRRRGWFGAGVGALMAASCAAGVVAGLLLIAPPEPGAAEPDASGEAVLVALTGPADAQGVDDGGEIG